MVLRSCKKYHGTAIPGLVDLKHLSDLEYATWHPERHFQVLAGQVWRTLS